MGGEIVISGGSSDNTNVNHTERIYRVIPGGLSVSRSIGDIEAKLTPFGGIPGVICSVPDIFSFNIESDHDFIIIGSDGLFDRLTNKTITLIVLETVKHCILNNINFSKMLELIITTLIKEAITKDSRDNISCVFLCFENLYNLFANRKTQKIETCIERLKYSELDYENLYDKLSTKLLYNWIKPQSTLFNRGDTTISAASVKFSSPKKGEIKKPKSRSFCCGIFS
jgi:hypothetical protein